MSFLNDLFSLAHHWVLIFRHRLLLFGVRYSNSLCLKIKTQWWAKENKSCNKDILLTCMIHDLFMQLWCGTDDTTIHAVAMELNAKENSRLIIKLVC